MAKSDPLPPGDADFILWHDHYTEAAPGVGALLGLSADDLAALSADNTSLHSALKADATAAAAAAQAKREKTAIRRSVEKNARALARRVKQHTNYTPALGDQLGIEGAEDATDMTTAKAQLWATAQAHNQVELGFTKSKSDGVNLYGQREGDAAFVFLARDTSSPYVDNRPLLAAGKPELRRYQAIYVVADEEVGQPSDEVVVTCQP